MEEKVLEQFTTLNILYQTGGVKVEHVTKILIFLSHMLLLLFGQLAQILLLSWPMKE